HGSAIAPAPHATTPRTTGPQQPPVTFTDCSSLFNFSAVPLPAARRSQLTFSCARLPVPLDYTDQSGPTINIELIKVHSSTNSTGNPLVVNPGGPGVSGIDLAVGMAIQASDRLLSHFDLVGFDPRGVGLSAPVTCVSDSEKDALNAASPNVLTPAGFASAKQLAKTVAEACSGRYGATLADFTTVQSVKDMDRIRAGLGEQQLNYLGFSYGTELGSVYAHLFPSNMGVAVLDGAVDPLTNPITSATNQLKGFEGAFDQFAADCLTRNPCSSLGNPRTVVEELVKQANTTPIRSSQSSETRTATGAIVLTGVLLALYARSEWPALGQALIAAQQGDAKGLFALADQYNHRKADGTYGNILDANTTISCNDSKSGPSDASIKATAATWSRDYPMFGLWTAATLFSCQAWQPQRTPVPLPTAATKQKVLVIGNLHDPATPYQGAKDLAKTMGNAELLTWDGEGHTSYLQGSRCIDKYVENYLINGALPPTGTTCPR
ncbi:MAG: Alpha/beta hydrolase family protein, partial [Pseudonocardia sp.]|nr:Alpha/beta hydrolase family protein [Pseudonocardia sp.]